MDVTSEQVNSSAIGACLALRFLFHPKARRVSRSQLPDLNDSAIFHRLWGLFGLVDPIVNSRLSTAEQVALDAFTRRFDELPWEILPEQPHISQLPDDDISSLTESGRNLYNHLIRRQKISLWRRIKLKLKGW